MIKFKFKKIPSLAKYFYFFGFLLLIIALVLFFYFPLVLDRVLLQQLFVGGAIVVAIGSVVNCLYQFRDQK